MIDTASDWGTILSAGREDRALAEEQPERSDRCRDRRAGLPLWQALAPPACSGLKAINLGVWGRAPRLHPGPVGHMSRSAGLGNRRICHGPAGPGAGSRPSFSKSRPIDRPKLFPNNFDFSLDSRAAVVHTFLRLVGVVL